MQNGPIQSSFVWQQVPIQAQGSLVGTVTFDVPKKILADLEKTGNLNMANFDESSEEAVSCLSLIHI